jgi:hypothetical protein
VRGRFFDKKLVQDIQCRPGLSLAIRDKGMFLYKLVGTNNFAFALDAVFWIGACYFSFLA